MLNVQSMHRRGVLVCGLDYTLIVIDIKFVAVLAYVYGVFLFPDYLDLLCKILASKEHEYYM